MKKLFFTLFICLMTFFSFSQENEWTNLNLPTDVNLNTAAVDKNGDIYVFGNKFGAVTKDNGAHWIILDFQPGIDGNNRQIGNIFSSCLEGDKIFLDSNLGSGLDAINEVRWIYTQQIDNLQDTARRALWSVSGLEGTVESFGNNPFRVFIADRGWSYDVKIHSYNTNSSSFYLPYTGSGKYQYNTKWRTRSASGGRMISMQMDRYNMWQEVFVSDDFGGSWEPSDVSAINQDQVVYISDISFSGTHGYLVGQHYGGYSFFLYESKDNGDTWQFIKQYANSGINDSITNYFKSIYNYDDAPISVGCIKLRDNSYDFPIIGGFVQYGENYQVISQHGLNYVTGNGNKVVAVGDHGQAYMLKSISAGIGLINKSDKNEEFLIYPNPCHDGQLKVKTSKLLRFELIDLLGKTVLNKNLEVGINTLNVKNLQQVYM